MLIALELTLVIHTASASAISAIAPRLAATHAGPGRKSAMKPSLNARTAVGADLHALAMGQSLSKPKRVQTPMVAPRCHCNRRSKMRRPYSHPCHSRQMALVMITGAAYRQLQRHRSPTIVSLLQYRIQPISDILKAAMPGEAPHGNTEIRTVRMVPAIPLHQSTTQCHPPHILNLGHQAIHGDIHHTSLGVCQP